MGVIPSLRIVVVGAGTGVGKTHVSCALASELRRRGVEVVARKPVESGYVEHDSDARSLAVAAQHATLTPLYALKEAVSPHRAARNEGREVALDAIVTWCGVGVPTLVETAGGLLSPLSQAATNLDLAERLEPTSVVLVALNRLGALHDVRACLLALAQAGMPAHVALCAPPIPDAATSHNAEELALLGWGASVVTFPRLALEADGTRLAAEQLLDALGVARSARP